MSSPPMERKSIRLTADDMKAAQARSAGRSRSQSPLRGLSLGGVEPSSPRRSQSPLRGLGLGGVEPSSPRRSQSPLRGLGLGGEEPSSPRRSPLSGLSLGGEPSSPKPELKRPTFTRPELKRPTSPVPSVGTETKRAPVRSFTFRPSVRCGRPSIFIFDEDGTRRVDLSLVDWENLNQYNIIELRGIANALGVDVPRWTDREVLIATILSLA